MRQPDYLVSDPPAPGTALEITPGILWIKLPLPLRLNHVNVWCLEEADGWTVIDTGADTADTRAQWEQHFAVALRGKPIVRLIATHSHLDHMGLSGWLCDRFGAPLHATLVEWQAGRLHNLGRQATNSFSERFCLSHGVEPHRVETYAAGRRSNTSMMGTVPDNVQRLRDGDRLTIGRGGCWQVITAGGHADEHASFYNGDHRILIAGDQILPRITPAICVFPRLPLADPLGEYLASLDRFRPLAPDTLVLPSHGLPFRGLADRLDGLAHHHDERLGWLLARLAAPQSAWTLACGLFPRAIDTDHGYLALCEALAHLHRLVADGRARRIGSAERPLFVRC